ncbi:MAG TPA: DinB family protein [Candidatus Eremiobacteraceae bacterium]|nr:DinB family protein [Candidatus Eremiobacteraceae bacterium]
MEIRDIGEFLNYFDKVHQRTMNVVRAIPRDKVDWQFREGKFTVGDLVRHIATANRYIFIEIARGNPSAYAGCGKALAASHDEIVHFAERLHREDVEILSGLSETDLHRKCTLPDGASITSWKWLRLMIEHEVHHRGQLYIYLSLMEVPSPPLYGMTSEQVRKLSSATLNVNQTG